MGISDKAGQYCSPQGLWSSVTDVHFSPPPVTLPHILTLSLLGDREAMALISFRLVPACPNRDNPRGQVC